MADSYIGGMDIDRRDKLARLGDMSPEACAIRITAARLVTGLQQQELAERAGVKKTTYNNMEMGRSYPSRQVMKFLYRVYRVDFNFMLFGSWAQLPMDVQTPLFEQLAVAEQSWDRKQG